ncbi:UNVERIFIED_CONTAM: hypothetical protein PYX00_001596 [Menopon gallinae]|uniref:Receptor protein-tyrosine kinase n=1 Tax=Menopon gallinae TaxID=328185 RepID=A0AAW2IE29_9NEOP
MSVPSNRQHHYRNLRERYTNCSYVDGNLELTWIQDENIDLSFLQHIREVTGYVLISHVHAKKVVLPNLQIIRGRTLFRLSIHQQEFALFITLCKAHSIEMPALRDILSGGVGIFDNYNLCHIRTINWKEIITGPGYTDIYVYNFTSPERNCTCDQNCTAGCWGEGPENCQKFSKINCSPQCSKGRCFGTNPRECCHLFCAGGCTGPKQTDCLACRNFYDDGECTQECPSMQTYNPSTYSWEYNPKGKYAYGATCVKNCPEHLLKDNGACVRSCPPNKRPVNGECVSCDGACPKSCKGEVSIHSGNVDSFKGCTVIDGSVSILEHSFNGFHHMDETNFTFGPRYQQMHPDRLEVFSSLKEVTGYINIQGSHPDFKNLSYFRNLEIIGGRTLIEVYSLYIVKTSLTSLGLQSLKKISSGGIGIAENSNLCFAEGIDWKTIRNSAALSTNDFISRNRPQSKCAAEGLVCDPQCSSEGCWGPGPDQCLSCVNFKSGNECIENCSAVDGMYMAGPKLCKPCHELCAGSCTGPGNRNCTKCKYVRDGPFCYATCPEGKYNDSGECKPCHQSCVKGCTGPLNRLGPGGCNSCKKAIINGDVTVESCLSKDEPCPTGYYNEWVGPQDQGPLKPLAEKAICRKCHPRCKKCTGYGIHVKVCQECTNYKKGEQCEDECPQDYYADEATQECLPCSSECKGCYGPEPSHCFTCRNFKLYLDVKDPKTNDTAFNCTSICPPEAPHKIFPEDDPQPYCSSQPIGPLSQFAGPTQWREVIIVIVVFLVSVILAFFLFYRWRTKMKAKEEQVKMTRVMTGMEDNEPLRPSNVKPNLAKLRIVKEAEMRKGGVLGFGAFGTVYKGVWVPEGENVKIPVAIKVLREGTSANTSKEFLEEAYIMASVEHPNLLQLLAVCMTTQMMLVTQLMPLGCLLDYVRNNRDKIGSKPLLNWCTQIAKGMAYLEEKRLVHRDLAARNVLVQTPNCVKITDFGLAKLLDINEEVYKAGGGKMPIKWLALECIQHRIFTHKSDVWAFGVTVWELLTYGERPYENVPARDVPELLEKGERLPQPPICTIDVYMTMVKCWMLDADSRPAFKELADDFAKMARDPGRYLVIQGDKFLKLPSYTMQQDRRDLVHTLSTGTSDGPETIMEADEYLQPQVQRPPILRGHPSSSTSSTPPVTPTLKQVAESPIPQNQHNWDRELLRYAHSHNGQGATVPSRYCADPLRLDVGPDDCFDAKPATIGDLKLNLPLDEDDYLMPSPQQNQITTTYMDIIGDNKSTDETDYRNGYPRSAYPGQDKLNTCVDNPEYIMNSDQTEGDIGIPVVGTSGKSVGINVANLQPNLPRPYIAQKSSEEESDHEYYNDIDRLQRELQPLRRNETTV